MIITCDTNFYRKLTEGVDVRDTDRLDKIISVIINAEKRKGVKAMMGSIVSSELMSHLVDKPHEYSFKSCLKGCIVLYKHCEDINNTFRVLPSPQTQIAVEYFNKKNVRAEDTQITIGQILSQISKEPTLETIKKYSVQLQQNKDFIREAEECLIEEIQNYCKIIDPQYKDWQLFTNNKQKRTQFLNFVNSTKFEEETAKAMLCAVFMQINQGIDESEALQNIKSDQVTTFIKSYASALSLRKYFWSQLLNTSFNLKEKSRANFLWDEQILYFIGKQVRQEKIVLVTSDKKMIDAARKCNTKDVIMSYYDYLQFLGVLNEVETLKHGYDKVTSSLVRRILITDTVNASNKALFERMGQVYTFLNPVSYLTALDNKELFSEMDGLFADGSLLAKAIKLVYGKEVTRRSFDMTSIAPDLFEYASKNGCSVYIVASKQEQVEKAVKIFKKRYPQLVFAGYRNGYFSSEAEMDYEAKRIAGLNPNFLIVGMGALMQEKFLIKAKEAGYQGIGFTCGGFIHQTSKDEINYYPAWVDKTNMRFMYRMWKEPHTRKRYLMAGLLFPVRFIAERVFG